MKALAVFNDSGPALWLKPGFRHVFVVLQTEHGWIAVEAGTDLLPAPSLLCRPDYDLAGFYRGHGFTVVETETRTRPNRPFVVAGTCLGMAKAFLGIGRPWIVTPYMLYRHLRG